MGAIAVMIGGLLNLVGNVQSAEAALDRRLNLMIRRIGRRGIG